MSQTKRSIDNQNDFDIAEIDQRTRQPSSAPTCLDPTRSSETTEENSTQYFETTHNPFLHSQTDAETALPTQWHDAPNPFLSNTSSSPSNPNPAFSHDIFDYDAIDTLDSRDISVGDIFSLHDPCVATSHTSPHHISHSLHEINALAAATAAPSITMPLTSVAPPPRAPLTVFTPANLSPSQSISPLSTSTSTDVSTHDSTSPTTATPSQTPVSLFSTASGRPLALRAAAVARAARLLSDDQDATHDEVRKASHSTGVDSTSRDTISSEHTGEGITDATTEHTYFSSSSSSASSSSSSSSSSSLFSTASGKPLRISAAQRARAARLFDADDTAAREEDTLARDGLQEKTEPARSERNDSENTPYSIAEPSRQESHGLSVSGASSLPVPSSSSALFSTASGKPIIVSAKARARAMRLMADQDDIVDQDDMVGHAQDTANHNSSHVKDAAKATTRSSSSTSASSNQFTSLFTTARGKPITISAQQRERAARLFAEDDRITGTEKEPAHVTDSAPLGHITTPAPDRSTKSYEDDTTGEASNTVHGARSTETANSVNKSSYVSLFSTASGKPVNVSAAQIARARRLMMDDDENFDKPVDNEDKKTGANDSSKHNSPQQTAASTDPITKPIGSASDSTAALYQSSNGNVDTESSSFTSLSSAFVTAQPPSFGFTTASGRSIKPSQASLARAARLMADVGDKTDSPNIAVADSGIAVVAADRAGMENNDRDLIAPSNALHKSVSDKDTTQLGASTFAPPVSSTQSSLFSPASAQSSAFSASASSSLFSRASGRPLKISLASLDRAARLMADDETAATPSTVANSENAVASSSPHAGQDLSENSPDDNAHSAIATSLSPINESATNAGFSLFSTARGRPVVVSASSRQRAAQMMADAAQSTREEGSGNASETNMTEKAQESDGNTMRGDSTATSTVSVPAATQQPAMPSVASAGTPVPQTTVSVEKPIVVVPSISTMAATPAPPANGRKALYNVDGSINTTPVKPLLPLRTAQFTSPAKEGGFLTPSFPKSAKKFRIPESKATPVSSPHLLKVQGKNKSNDTSDAIARLNFQTEDTPAVTATSENLWKSGESLPMLSFAPTLDPSDVENKPLSSSSVYIHLNNTDDRKPSNSVSPSLSTSSSKLSPLEEYLDTIVAVHRPPGQPPAILLSNDNTMESCSVSTASDSTKPLYSVSSTPSRASYTRTAMPTAMLAALAGIAPHSTYTVKVIDSRDDGAESDMNDLGDDSRSDTRIDDAEAMTDVTDISSSGSTVAPVTGCVSATVTDTKADASVLVSGVWCPPSLAAVTAHSASFTQMLVPTCPLYEVLPADVDNVENQERETLKPAQQHTASGNPGNILGNSGNPHFLPPCAVCGAVTAYVHMDVSSKEPAACKAYNAEVHHIRERLISEMTLEREREKENSREMAILAALSCDADSAADQASSRKRKITDDEVTDSTESLKQRSVLTTSEKNLLNTKSNTNTSLIAGNPKPIGKSPFPGYHRPLPLCPRCLFDIDLGQEPCERGLGGINRESGRVSERFIPTFRNVSDLQFPGMTFPEVLTRHSLLHWHKGPYLTLTWLSETIPATVANSEISAVSSTSKEPYQQRAGTFIGLWHHSDSAREVAQAAQHLLAAGIPKVQEKSEIPDRNSFISSSPPLQPLVFLTIRMPEPVTHASSSARSCPLLFPTVHVSRFSVAIAGMEANCAASTETMRSEGINQGDEEKTKKRSDQLRKFCQIPGVTCHVLSGLPASPGKTTEYPECQRLYSMANFSDATTAEAQMHLITSVFFEPSFSSKINSACSPVESNLPSLGLLKPIIPSSPPPSPFFSLLPRTALMQVAHMLSLAYIGWSHCHVLLTMLPNIAADALYHRKHCIPQEEQPNITSSSDSSSNSSTTASSLITKSCRCKQLPLMPTPLVGGTRLSRHLYRECLWTLVNREQRYISGYLTKLGERNTARNLSELSSMDDGKISSSDHTTAPSVDYHPIASTYAYIPTITVPSLLNRLRSKYNTSLVHRGPLQQLLETDAHPHTQFMARITAVALPAALRGGVKGVADGLVGRCARLRAELKRLVQKMEKNGASKLDSHTFIDEQSATDEARLFAHPKTFVSAAFSKLPIEALRAVDVPEDDEDVYIAPSLARAQLNYEADIREMSDACATAVSQAISEIMTSDPSLEAPKQSTTGLSNTDRLSPSSSLSNAASAALTHAGRCALQTIHTTLSAQSRKLLSINSPLLLALIHMRLTTVGKFAPTRSPVDNSLDHVNTASIRARNSSDCQSGMFIDPLVPVAPPQGMLLELTDGRTRVQVGGDVHMHALWAGHWEKLLKFIRTSCEEAADVISSEFDGIGEFWSLSDAYERQGADLVVEKNMTDEDAATEPKQEQSDAHSCPLAQEEPTSREAMDAVTHETCQAEDITETSAMTDLMSAPVGVTGVPPMETSLTGDNDTSHGKMPPPQPNETDPPHITPISAPIAHDEPPTTTPYTKTCTDEYISARHQYLPPPTTSQLDANRIVRVSEILPSSQEGATPLEVDVGTDGFDMWVPELGQLQELQERVAVVDRVCGDVWTCARRAFSMSSSSESRAAFVDVRSSGHEAVTKAVKDNLRTQLLSTLTQRLHVLTSHLQSISTLCTPRTDPSGTAPTFAEHLALQAVRVWRVAAGACEAGRRVVRLYVSRVAARDGDRRGGRREDGYREHVHFSDSMTAASGVNGEVYVESLIAGLLSASTAVSFALQVLIHGQMYSQGANTRTHTYTAPINTVPKQIHPVNSSITKASSQELTSTLSPSWKALSPSTQWLLAISMLSTDTSTAHVSEASATYDAYARALERSRHRLQRRSHRGEWISVDERESQNFSEVDTFSRSLAWSFSDILAVTVAAVSNPVALAIALKGTSQIENDSNKRPTSCVSRHNAYSSSYETFTTEMLWKFTNMSSHFPENPQIPDDFEIPMAPTQYFSLLANSTAPLPVICSSTPPSLISKMTQLLAKPLPRNIASSGNIIPKPLFFPPKLGMHPYPFAPASSQSRPYAGLIPTLSLCVVQTHRSLVFDSGTGWLLSKAAFDALCSREADRVEKAINRRIQEFSSNNKTSSMQHNEETAAPIDQEAIRAIVEQENAASIVGERDRFQHVSVAVCVESSFLCWCMCRCHAKPTQNNDSGNSVVIPKPASGSPKKAIGSIVSDIAPALRDLSQLCQCGGLRRGRACMSCTAKYGVRVIPPTETSLTPSPSQSSSFDADTASRASNPLDTQPLISRVGIIVGSRRLAVVLDAGVDGDVSAPVGVDVVRREIADIEKCVKLWSESERAQETREDCGIGAIGPLWPTPVSSSALEPGSFIRVSHVKLVGKNIGEFNRHSRGSIAPNIGDDDISQIAAAIEGKSRTSGLKPPYEARKLVSGWNQHWDNIEIPMQRHCNIDPSLPTVKPVSNHTITESVTKSSSSTVSAVEAALTVPFPGESAAPTAQSWLTSPLVSASLAVLASEKRGETLFAAPAAVASLPDTVGAQSSNPDPRNSIEDSLVGTVDGETMASSSLLPATPLTRLVPSVPSAPAVPLFYFAGRGSALRPITRYSHIESITSLHQQEAVRTQEAVHERETVVNTSTARTPGLDAILPRSLPIAVLAAQRPGAQFDACALPVGCTAKLRAVEGLDTGISSIIRKIAFSPEFARIPYFSDRILDNSRLSLQDPAQVQPTSNRSNTALSALASTSTPSTSSTSSTSTNTGPAFYTPQKHSNPRTNTRIYVPQSSSTPQSAAASRVAAPGDLYVSVACVTDGTGVMVVLLPHDDTRNLPVAPFTSSMHGLSTWLSKAADTISKAAGTLSKSAIDATKIAEEATALAISLSTHDSHTDSPDNCKDVPVSPLDTPSAAVTALAGLQSLRSLPPAPTPAALALSALTYIGFDSKLGVHFAVAGVTANVKSLRTEVCERLCTAWAQQSLAHGAVGSVESDPSVSLTSVRAIQPCPCSDSPIEYQKPKKSSALPTSSSPSQPILSPFQKHCRISEVARNPAVSSLFAHQSICSWAQTVAEGFAVLRNPQWSASELAECVTSKRNSSISSSSSLADSDPLSRADASNCSSTSPLLIPSLTELRTAVKFLALASRFHFSCSEALSAASSTNMGCLTRVLELSASILTKSETTLLHEPPSNRKEQPLSANTATSPARQNLNTSGDSTTVFHSGNLSLSEWKNSGPWLLSPQLQAYCSACAARWQWLYSHNIHESTSRARNQKTGAIGMTPKTPGVTSDVTTPNRPSLYRRRAKTPAPSPIVPIVAGNSNDSVTATNGATSVTVTDAATSANESSGATVPLEDSDTSTCVALNLNESHSAHDISTNAIPALETHTATASSTSATDATPDTHTTASQEARGMPRAAIALVNVFSQLDSQVDQSLSSDVSSASTFNPQEPTDSAASSDIAVDIASSAVSVNAILATPVRPAASRQRRQRSPELILDEHVPPAKRSRVVANRDDSDRGQDDGKSDDIDVVDLSSGDECDGYMGY